MSPARGGARWCIFHDAEVGRLTTALLSTPIRGRSALGAALGSVVSLPAEQQPIRRDPRQLLLKAPHDSGERDRRWASASVALPPADRIDVHTRCLGELRLGQPGNGAGNPKTLPHGRVDHLEGR